MKILGISCFYHDAAASLIIDGRIVAASDEERFSRIKHDPSFPIQAIKFCLKQAEVDAQDLDWVVFYEKPFLKFERLTLTFLATAPRSRESFVNAYKAWLKSKLWIKATIAGKLKVKSSKILFSGHHLSHAASSYYTSPFKSAALLTCDGVGEWTTTAWGVAKNNKLKLKREIKFPHSLGLLYSVFTQYLGFEINEGEYKVMGLAPFGKPKYKDQVGKLIKQNSDGSFNLCMDYFSFHTSDKVSFNKKFVKLLGAPPVLPGQSDKVEEFYADIASSIQQVLEEKITNIARMVRQKTGEENLCYSGGVALNGVANWRIFKEAGFKNIFIHPAAGDSGGAVGAALYLYHHILGFNQRIEFDSVYLGLANSNESVYRFLLENKIKSRRMTDSQLQNYLVRCLLEGKVVGWVRGRFEWGPRALGARSILADPRDKKMKDLVNSKIKFREGFRPFAPVTLYETGEKYFEVGRDFNQAPLEYMLAVVTVKKKWQAKLGAVTHVDGTARPQFIKRETNPAYYDLIQAFGEKSGVSVLLNTSFNLKGEPIVNTPKEAYETFMKSGLDILVLENYLVEK